jgi:hypothetical protein
VTAFRSNSPAADISESHAGGAGVGDLRFHSAPQPGAPRGTAIQGGCSDRQLIEGFALGLLMQTETGADFAFFGEGQEVPAFLIDRKIMAAVGGQVFSTNGAVLEVDLASKSLHGGEELGVQPVIRLDVLKNARGPWHQEGIG